MAWICAGRPLDGHNLTFETLRRLLGQPLVRFVLRSTTFETFLNVLQSRNRQPSSPHAQKVFDVVEYIFTVIHVNIPL